MTLSTVNIEEIKKHLNASSKDFKSPVLSSARIKQDSPSASLTGKALVQRLTGLLTPEEADTLERHINESCEQEND